MDSMSWLIVLMVITEHAMIPFNYVRTVIRNELVYLPFWIQSI